MRALYTRFQCRPAAACLIATLTLCGCGGGGGDGYGCTGRTCKASFQGPGEQDLSDELGDGATVKVDDVEGNSAVVKIAGQDAKLVRGELQKVAGYDVTLTEVDGDDVSIRIVGE